MAGVIHVNAQNTLVDSIQTGPGYANDVFYSLNNGTVLVTPNNDWQLGFSIGVFSVSVRTNATTSSSAIGSVIAYEMPGTDTSNWADFDTTGFHSWPILENSDNTWETGALNSNSNGNDDYGWGLYDPNSHKVLGHRLYLLAVNNGSGTSFMKVFVVSKSLGAWVVKTANIDGSNEKQYEFGQSNGFSNKNFVYINLLTGNFMDREPVKTTWDFVLTRYRAFQAGAGIYYPSTGILTNAGVKVAEARGIPASEANLNDFIADTTSNISEIGSDWKVLSGPSFQIADSLCYFIKAKDGAFWKLKFTKFAGSSTGNTVFEKTKLTPATGLQNNATRQIQLAVYPNPASDNMQVLYDAQSQASEINVYHINGQLALQVKEEITQSFVHNLPVFGLNQGVYILEVKTINGVAKQKIVIN